MSIHWRHLTTAERIETIKSVYVSGDSARDIGEQIGITRNAVIGMYGRYPEELVGCPLRARGGAGKRGRPRSQESGRSAPGFRVGPRVQKSSITAPFSSAFGKRATPPPPPPPSRKSHAEMVADWTAKYGAPRRFGQGESAHYYDVQRFLGERGHKLSGAGGKYRLDGKTMAWAPVLAIVDEYRVSEGLQPIRARAA